MNSWAGYEVALIHICRRYSFTKYPCLAGFDVDKTGESGSVTMRAGEGGAKVHVSGKVVDSFSADSVSVSPKEASIFFESRSLGYSDGRHEGVHEGLELKCENWHVESLEVDSIQASYFEDP